MATRFEPGAPPDDGGIPLAVPTLGGNEWKYVKECLDTGWVSSVGSYVERFEREIAAYLGAKHAVSTVNGTSAIHIALLCADVQPGDEVLVSTLSFIAPANAIRYAGAWPVFVDADPEYWQMDTEKLRRFVSEGCLWDGRELRNRRTQRRIRAIVPVHVLGHPVDMDPIQEIAARYHLSVLEDASECLGASYRGRKVGNLGRAGCLSFNGNKIITTGGGGMLVTNDEALAARARYLTTQAKDDPVEYVHNSVGYNYRLTNIQAAVGCAQLEQLESHVTAKRQIAASYHEAFKNVAGLDLMKQAPWAESNWWLYTILANDGFRGGNSRAILERLGRARIQARPLWQPLHLSPAHRGCQSVGCEVAVELNRRALSLPCSVSLSKDDQRRVIAGVLASG
jgi:perosamine synthetase